MIRVAVHGTGRMARAVVDASEVMAGVKIVALVGRSEPSWASGIAACRSLGQLPQPPDLVIDFSLADGVRAAAEWSGSHGVPLVSGVTGLSTEAEEALERASRAAPVLWSANLSLGANLLADLAERAAAVLEKDVPVEIEDVHHQWKQDSPSGTALMLGNAISARRAGKGRIDYRSVRQGEVVGEHSITFRLADETLVLAHKAHDRGIFAAGALMAGKWLCTQPPGLYSARDWLRDQ